MKLAALKAARPRASYDIASEIASMIFNGDENAEGGDDDYVMVAGAMSGAIAANASTAEAKGVGTR